MRSKKQFFFLIAFSIILATVFVVDERVKSESTPYDLIVDGLVDHPLNFTYSKLQKFPMVSEVALLECIGGWTQLYNWTGIPLFFLLSATGVKTNVTEVVFYGSDGFSSSLTVEKALHPTTLLALKANGTVLSSHDGYPYRIVAPCKYGYKWVKWITKIELVDYDYKGSDESIGYSDEADVLGCSLPSTTPSFKDYNVDLGYTNYNVTILSNSTINSLDFDRSQRQISFNITGPLDTIGYCYVIIPRKLLWSNSLEEWQVWVDNTVVENREVITVANHTCLYFAYNHTTETVHILGAHAIVPHDIGITWLGTSKTVIGQTFPLHLNVTIFNFGQFAENFNITIYANITTIATITNITLSSQNSTTVTFTWHPTMGKYSISAKADLVLGEIDTADNTCIGGIVVITTPGDVDGDGVVGGLDAGLLGLHWPPQPYYPNCDIDGDGVIGGLDAGMIGLNWVL